jgi:hypothetical protein
MDSYTPHAVWSSFVSSLCVATLATTLACEPFALPSHPSDASAASDEAARDTQPGAGDSARPGDAAGDRAGSDLVGGPGDLAHETGRRRPRRPRPPAARRGRRLRGRHRRGGRARLRQRRPRLHRAAAHGRGAAPRRRRRRARQLPGPPPRGLRPDRHQRPHRHRGPRRLHRQDLHAAPGRRRLRGPRDGEVVAFKPSSVGAARSWMESLYHRLPLLDPAVDEAGFGETAEGARYANVLGDGPGRDAHPAPGVLAWPPRGARDVPTSWDGAEIPQPPPPPAGYPSGPVVTLHATARRPRRQRRHHRPGARPARPLAMPPSLTSHNDPNLKPGVLSLIPHRPLAPSTTYRVRVEGTPQRRRALRRRPGPSPRKGAGCERHRPGLRPRPGLLPPLRRQPTCLWSGTRPVDSACEYVNDCGPGLTCFGSRCRPLCDNVHRRLPGASAKHGVGLLGAQSPAAVCLPPSCITDASDLPRHRGLLLGRRLRLRLGRRPRRAAPPASTPTTASPGYGCLGLAGRLPLPRAVRTAPTSRAARPAAPAALRSSTPTHGVRFCQ